MLRKLELDFKHIAEIIVNINILDSIVVNHSLYMMVVKVFEHISEKINIPVIFGPAIDLHNQK